MLQIAHTGHWLVNVVYLLPFVAFLGWLIITTIRERRQSGEEGSESPDG